MRKVLFRLGWVILLLLPVAYAIQIYRTQDLPPIELWKWLIAFAAVVLIFFSRNTDDVLHHHLIE